MLTCLFRNLSKSPAACEWSAYQKDYLPNLFHCLPASIPRCCCSENCSLKLLTFFSVLHLRFKSFWITLPLTGHTLHTLLEWWHNNNASEGVVTRFVSALPLCRKFIHNHQNLGHLQESFALAFKTAFGSIIAGRSMFKKFVNPLKKDSFKWNLNNFILSSFLKVIRAQILALFLISHQMFSQNGGEIWLGRNGNLTPTTGQTLLDAIHLMGIK